MISHNEESVLADLATELARLNIPMAVIGAGARLLMFDWKYNLTQRTTTDWDFAVKIDSWNDYSSLRRALLETTFFRETSVSHRLLHKSGVKVDIIPFGGLEKEDHIIVWPDGIHMSVAGFAEAFDNVEQCQLLSSVKVSVVSIPALLVLKLFAFKERVHLDDLKDVAFILRNYFKYVGEERIFDELYNELADGLLYECAGPFLLGKDVGRLCSLETLSRIISIVKELSDPFSREIETLLEVVSDSTQEYQKRQELSLMFSSFADGMRFIMEENA
ncbi:MAG: hypothetical protein PHT33_08710 [bacterium]|nr:hypothetical protein [bacterium]